MSSDLAENHYSARYVPKPLGGMPPPAARKLCCQELSFGTKNRKSRVTKNHFSKKTFQNFFLTTPAFVGSFEKNQFGVHRSIVRVRNRRKTSCFSIFSVFAQKKISQSKNCNSRTKTFFQLFFSDFTKTFSYVSLTIFLGP